MREILFRGKTPSQDEYFDDGEWVEGFYTRFNGKEHRIYSGYAETDCGDYYPDWCNVRAETVGQYTDLTDKNSKKIFEGDIIKADNWLHQNMKVYTVVFEDGGFYAKYKDEDGWNFDHLGNIEVIGNIHDNKDLLEVK